MKNPCVSCTHSSKSFRLGIDREGIPYIHCLHPKYTEEDLGWSTLKEGFGTCKNFERKEKNKEVLL